VGRTSINRSLDLKLIVSSWAKARFDCRREAGRQVLSERML